jgi:hypothetical protein
VHLHFLQHCTETRIKFHWPLVTRNRIPDEIYESWNTQPVVAGSDLEHDDCSDHDVLFSDTDSLDDSVGNKSDNELASSLMELDMASETEVKDLIGKGKMKAAPARSPATSRNGNPLFMMRVVHGLINFNSEAQPRTAFPITIRNYY